jgi:CheY-like chemotaxis protein
MEAVRSAPPCLRVAILNDGDDTIAALSEWFQMHGHLPLAMKVSDLRSRLTNPSEIVDAVNPDVLVFDVGLPYAVNWYYTEVLKMSLPNLPIVLTTANRSALKAIVGGNGVFELTGTAQNLTDLLALVYAACGRNSDGHVDVKRGAS